MRFKLTFFLLALNVALGALIYHLETRPGRSAFAGKDRRVFPPGLVEACDYIEIESSVSPQNWVLQRENNDWEITAPITWRANTNAVVQIVTELQFLAWESSFRVDAIGGGRSLADYGLEEPKAKITVGYGSQRRTIQIGEATGVGNNLYLLSDDGERVMVVDRELFRRVSIGVGKLRSHRVFDMSLFEVRALSLETGAGANVLLRFNPEKDQWAFELPIKTLADPSKVESAIVELTGTKIVAFVKPDPARQGLEKPSMRIALEGTARREILLVGDLVPLPETPVPAPGADPGAGAAVSPPAGGGDEGAPAVTAAAEDEEPPRFYYAKLEGDNPSVFAIPAAAVDPLKAAQVNLRERKFVQFSVLSLAAIDISAKGDEITLQKLENGGWQVMAKGADSDLASFPADPGRLGEVIASLASLEAQEFVSDTPSEADIQAHIRDDPRLTITIKSEDGSRTLLIGAKDDAFYATLADAGGKTGSIYEIDPLITVFTPAKLLHYRHRTLVEYPNQSKVAAMKLTDLTTGEVFLDLAPDPVSQTWYTVTEGRPEEYRGAVFDLMKTFRTAFVVGSYVKDAYDPADFKLGSGITSAWKYRLEIKVALPGGGATEEAVYQFTKPFGRTTQYGGSPGPGVTFKLAEPLTDILRILTVPPDKPEPIKPEEIDPGGEAGGTGKDN